MKAGRSPDAVLPRMRSVVEGSAGGPRRASGRMPLLSSDGELGHVEARRTYEGGVKQRARLMSSSKPLRRPAVDDQSGRKYSLWAWYGYTRSARPGIGIGSPCADEHYRVDVAPLRLTARRRRSMVLATASSVSRRLLYNRRMRRMCRFRCPSRRKSASAACSSIGV